MTKGSKPSVLIGFFLKFYFCHPSKGNLHIPDSVLLASPMAQGKNKNKNKNLCPTSCASPLLISWHHIEKLNRNLQHPCVLPSAANILPIALGVPWHASSAYGKKKLVSFGVLS